MSLDQEILKIVGKKLEDGTVEKIIEEEFAKGVQKAMSSLFSSYGDVTKVIESKVKDVMVPFIENYNYQDYVVKLDTILQEVLKSSALENKKLLENFKTLMIPTGEKDLAVTDLFEEWKEYVRKHVETDGLEVDFDEGEPSYEYVDVSFTVEEADNPSWSNMKQATIYFTCDHDENMNIAIPIHSWKDWDKEQWTLDYKVISDIKALRNLNEFEIFLMKMQQNFSRLILDKDYDSDEIEPEDKPEASWD